MPLDAAALPSLLGPRGLQEGWGRAAGRAKSLGLLRASRNTGCWPFGGTDYPTTSIQVKSEKLGRIKYF